MTILTFEKLKELVDNNRTDCIKMITRSTNDRDNPYCRETTGLRDFKITSRTGAYSNLYFVTWSDDEGDPEIMLHEGDKIEMKYDLCDVHYQYTLYLDDDEF